MEGFWDRISTSPPSPTRIPPLLHRTRAILPPTGPGRCMVYHRDRDPLVGITNLYNIRTDVLVSMPIQDPVPQGCHLSTPRQTQDSSLSV